MDVNDFSFVQVPQEVMQMANPFGDNDCVRLGVAKAINVSQLTDELESRLGHSFQVILSGMDGTVDHDRPGFLFISPPVSEGDLLDVIADHSPDPDYGLSEDHRERRDLLSKLRAGQDLTGEELSRAIQIALANG